MRLPYFGPLAVAEPVTADTLRRAPRRTRPHESPRILSCRWGRVEVAGRESPLRDAILFPGGAREWDWTTHGTSHGAGIQPDDVGELLERGVGEMVLSRGWFGRLRIPPETLDLLAARGVPVHVLRTGAAVERYNELAAMPSRRAVGALIHSTC
jgi:hypothetical protein